MKNKKGKKAGLESSILTVVLVLASLAILIISLNIGINFISAEDTYTYYRFCLGDEQSIHIVSNYSSGIPGVNKLVCANGFCTCHLLSGSGYCDICVYKIGDIYSPPGLGTHCDFACGYNSGGGGGGGGVITPDLTMNVFTPIAGNYSKSLFYIHVETNQIASIKLYDNILGTQRTLCPNRKYYNQASIFRYGWNNITIMSVKGDQILRKNIVFMIDNKKPVVSRTYPLAYRFLPLDAGFNITYTEDNVKKVTFNYGTLENMKKLNLNCPSGKLQLCSVDSGMVNLSEFNGKFINFNFTITDTVGNFVSSRNTKVKIDTVSPVITAFNYSIKGILVKFIINVTDDNFQKIIYSDNGGYYRTMCSSLYQGRCIKTLYLSKTTH